MRILVTNDDGIHAEGLEVLTRLACTLSSDVWVVAPETDQSGVAHSLTLNDPLRLRQVGPQRYALRGTPTDCVIMALDALLPGKPDLLLSGINNGQNLADDITYSGTVAAAIEGALLGVRSIALSQAYPFREDAFADYTAAEQEGSHLLKRLLAVDLPLGTFLNVNFPPRPISTPTPVAITVQGRRDAALLHVEKRRDGRGNPYYWLVFRGEDVTSSVPDTDLHAVAQGKISITPLHADLTHYGCLQKLTRSLDLGQVQGDVHVSTP